MFLGTIEGNKVQNLGIQVRILHTTNILPSIDFFLSSSSITATLIVFFFLLIWCLFSSLLHFLEFLPSLPSCFSLTLLSHSTSESSSWLLLFRVYTWCLSLFSSFSNHSQSESESESGVLPLDFLLKLAFQSLSGVLCFVCSSDLRS